MPLELSSVAIGEKNKLSTDSVFLLALEVTIPGVTDPVRVVDDTQDMVWRGVTWQRFPFILEDLTENTTDAPKVSLKIANVDRQVEAFLHNYDSHVKQNGYSPIICKIFVVNSKNLGSSVPEAEHEFILVQPKATPAWVTFTLGASNPWNIRYPLNRMVPSCRWKFKSAQCGYSGVVSSCNKALYTCRSLGNSKRWGGSYGLGSTV